MGESTELKGLLPGRNPEKVRAVLNFLVESPYFYREDDETAFNFLRRHRQEFARFFEQFFGWTLIVDSKCGRVYKERWYNGSVTESNRDFFNFTRRDECIAFMMILEFFEHQLDENDMTVEDRENLRFRFGDLLEFCTRRFVEIMDGSASRYTPEHIRAKILRQVFPILERYRFVKRIPPPPGETIDEEHTIYEALPAIHHYNSSYLHRNFDEISSILQGQRVSGEEADEDEATEEEPAP